MNYNIDTATEYFYLQHQRPPKEDTSLPLRINYAYAVYYLFQYNSEYWRNQMSVTYEDEMLEVLDKIENCEWWKTAKMSPEEKEKYNSPDNVNRAVIGNTSKWNAKTGTSRAVTLLGMIKDEKNITAVNKFGAVTNLCGYIDAPDNSNIAQAALYLASPDYYAPVSYYANDETYGSYGKYPTAEKNTSPTAFYEAVFRELWLSEPEENADWWSRFKFAMGAKAHAALVDPFEMINGDLENNPDDFKQRADFIFDSQQGHPSSWQGDVSMSLPGITGWGYAECPFCGHAHNSINPNEPDSDKNGLTEEQKKECIKKRYELLWGNGVEMTYFNPVNATSDPLSTTDSGYHDVFPTPNTGSGGLLQSDVCGRTHRQILYFSRV